MVPPQTIPLVLRHLVGHVQIYDVELARDKDTPGFGYDFLLAASAAFRSQ